MVRRIALTALLVGVSMAALAPPAAAAPQAVVRLHLPIAVWRSAGRPAVHYINDPTEPGGRYARWGDAPGTIILNRAPGTNVSMRKTALHELGHAWADKHHVDYARYAAIRGFPAGTDDYTLVEDYAETFQVALADDWPHTGNAPYGFHNAAGEPTSAQFQTLRGAGLLPH